MGGVILMFCLWLLGCVKRSAFVPPTCPPILALRSLTISHDGRLLQAYEVAESEYLVGYWTLDGILMLCFPNFFCENNPICRCASGRSGC